MRNLRFVLTKFESQKIRRFIPSCVALRGQGPTGGKIAHGRGLPGRFAVERGARAMAVVGGGRRGGILVIRKSVREKKWPHTSGGIRKQGLTRCQSGEPTQAKYHNAKQVFAVKSCSRTAHPELNLIIRKQQIEPLFGQLGTELDANLELLDI